MKMILLLFLYFILSFLTTFLILLLLHFILTLCWILLVYFFLILLLGYFLFILFLFFFFHLFLYIFIVVIIQFFSHKVLFRNSQIQYDWSTFVLGAIKLFYCFETLIFVIHLDKSKSPTLIFVRMFRNVNLFNLSKWTYELLNMLFINIKNQITNNQTSMPNLFSFRLNFVRIVLIFKLFFRFIFVFNFCVFGCVL